MVRFGGMHGVFGSGSFFRWFERGDIKYLILDLLAEKPRHGYEIIKELEARFCGFYTPSAGSVYPTLQMLEDLGFVRSQEGEGKKTYEITDKGREELKEHQAKVGSIWDATEHWQSFRMHDLNDLFEELSDLKKVVRGKMRAHGLTAEKLKKIQKIISSAKNEILEVLKS
jgi:DNA-binding PadR family transcriptional regulator